VIFFSMASMAFGTPVLGGTSRMNNDLEARLLLFLKGKQ
jgi:hypothetical protein